jgi:hypothetical protein
VPGAFRGTGKRSWGTESSSDCGHNIRIRRRKQLPYIRRLAPEYGSTGDRANPSCTGSFHGAIGRSTTS